MGSLAARKTSLQTLFFLPVSRDDETTDSTIQMKQYLGLVLVEQKEERRKCRAVLCNVPSHRPLHGDFSVARVVSDKGLSSRAEGRALTKMPPTALYS